MKRRYRRNLRNLALALFWAHVHGQSEVIASLLESMTPQERAQVRGIVAHLHQVLQEYNHEANCGPAAG